MSTFKQPADLLLLHNMDQDSNNNTIVTNAATTSPSDQQLNPRSCVTCRRRKIRCNKHHPCSNCVKARVECTFPGPGRAPRKTKKAADSELLLRLKTLETVVKDLGGLPEGSDDSGAARNSAADESGANGKVNDKKASAQEGSVDNATEEMGRLVVGEGRSRYVSHRFWTKFGDEVSFRVVSWNYNLDLGKVTCCRLRN